MRRPTLALLVLSVLAVVARAEGPADGLLKLAPADAGATLVVEDLRGFVRTFQGSPLAEGLANLPAVRAWRGSDAHQVVEKALGDIEAVTGAPPATLRDDLLGEAVVLSLRVPPDAGPDAARGLLLTKVRDRDLLNRLIDAANQGDRDSGTLADLETRRRGAESYHVRRFRDDVKPTEYYSLFGDDIFAWSNSEELIQGAIDRHAPGAAAGLGAEPRFRKVRAALPARAVASLFVDPRVPERLIAADAMVGAADPTEAARRGLAAVEYAGLAIEWRDGFVAHAHASLDPKAIGEPLRRWAKGSEDASALIRRLPPSTLALAVGRVDFEALHDLIWDAVGGAVREKAGLFEAVAKGLLLGKDLRKEILPDLGPGVLAGLDEPSGDAWPVVLAIGLRGGAEASGVPAAIENALRTVAALTALGRDRGEAQGPTTERRDGVRLTTLPGARFAFAVGPGVLVVGNVPDAVVAVARGDRGGPGARLERFRSTYLENVNNFVLVDLDRLVRVADARRGDLARRLAARRDAADDDARRDLDRALDLLRLFDAAFAAAEVAPDATAFHMKLGLIAK